MAAKTQTWYVAALHLILIALAFQVVGLIRDNRQLRQGTAQGPPEQIGPGDVLQSAAFVELDGAPANLGPAGEASDRDQLLLVFSTTCPACNDTRPVWMDLYEQASERYQIVGVSLSGAEESRQYAAEHDLPFPVVLPAEPQTFISTNRIVGVPTTLRVSSAGEVRQVWLGNLADEDVRKLAEPGLG